MERIKELLEQLKLHFQVEIAFSDVLDQHEEKFKKSDNEFLKVNTRLTSLDKRYAELLMVLKDINKKLGEKGLELK